MQFPNFIVKTKLESKLFMQRHRGERTDQGIFWVELSLGFLSLQSELAVFGLDPGRRGERLIARVGLRPPLLPDNVPANQVPEVDGQVTPQEGFAARDGEQGGEQFSVKLWF